MCARANFTSRWWVWPSAWTYTAVGTGYHDRPADCVLEFKGPLSGAIAKGAVIAAGCEYN